MVRGMDGPAGAVAGHAAPGLDGEPSRGQVVADVPVTNVSVTNDPVADVAPVTDHAGHHGYADHKADHLRRLRRIEGQTRGLQRMIENDEYCIDVLTQVSATTSALRSLALSLLEEHLGHCVAHAIQSGGQEADDKLAEANAAIARLVRS